MLGLFKILKNVMSLCLLGMLAIYFPHHVCMMFGCPKAKKKFLRGLGRAGLKRAGQGLGGTEDRYCERSEQDFFLVPHTFLVPSPEGTKKAIMIYVETTDI